MMTIVIEDGLFVATATVHDAHSRRVRRHVEHGRKANKLVRLGQMNAVLLESFEVNGEHGGHLAQQVLFGRGRVGFHTCATCALVAHDLVAQRLDRREFSQTLLEIRRCRLVRKLTVAFHGL